MAICSVKISLKNISPTVIAVTGSIAPKTDVMVDPIRFIAWMRAKFEIIVGIIASSRSDPKDFHEGMGCTPENKDIPVNKIIPPNKNT